MAGSSPGNFSQVCIGFADILALPDSNTTHQYSYSNAFRAMTRAARESRQVLPGDGSLWSDHRVIVVSPILKRVVYPWLANSGYLRRRADGGAFCVLTYHGIFPAGYGMQDANQDGSLVSAENFRAQLQLLKDCYCVVSPEEVRDWVVDGRALPERAVLLTCDDGLRNVLTDMTPILREEGLSCLFFALGASTVENPRMLWYDELYFLLVAGPAGSYSLAGLGDGRGIGFELGDGAQRRSAWWNLVKTLSQYDQPARDSFIEGARCEFGLPQEWNADYPNSEVHRRRFGLLNRSELRQLVEQGMSIGSHTLNHPMLSQQPSDLAWKEISESRGLLEDAIGKPIWALAYPFGDPGSVMTREMQMADQAGYQCAFMNVGGGFGASLPMFALPRVHVSADMNLAEFEAHLSGFHRDFRSRLSGTTP
jgi:peptidoglycan/xylan/chitin deacetylase (PgdA/CDA1 family)